MCSTRTICKSGVFCSLSCFSLLQARHGTLSRTPAALHVVQNGPLRRQTDNRQARGEGGKDYYKRITTLQGWLFLCLLSLSCLIRARREGYDEMRQQNLLSLPWTSVPFLPQDSSLLRMLFRADFPSSKTAYRLLIDSPFVLRMQAARTRRGASGGGKFRRCHQS